MTRDLTTAEQDDGREDDGDNPLRAPAQRMPAGKPAPGAPRQRSGKHADPRRKLSASAEAWLLWDLAAAHDQRTFADWARGVLTVAAAEALKLDPVTALEAIGE